MYHPEGLQVRFNTQFAPPVPDCSLATRNMSGQINSFLTIPFIIEFSTIENYQRYKNAGNCFAWRFVISNVQFI